MDSPAAISSANGVPSLRLPPIGDEDRRHLIEQVCHGSFSGKDLKDKPVKAVVKSWLSGAQQELLDKHAPERLTLANGRTAKVRLRAPATRPTSPCASSNSSV